MKASLCRHLGSPAAIKVQPVAVSNRHASKGRAAALAILFAGVVSSRAAVFSWDGGGADGNWTSATNWTTDVAPPSDGSADIRLPYNVAKYAIQVDSPRWINSLLFQNTGTSNNTFVLSGANLTIDDEASGSAVLLQKNSVTATINCDVALTKATVQNLGLGNSDTLQFGGTVTAPNSGAATIKCNYTSTAQVLASGALDVADLTVQGTGTAGTYTFALQLDHSAALADGMTLRLVDSANTKAKVSLNFTGEERVLALTINGTPQATGTYGGTGSGAQNIDPTHFSGTGRLIVGPLPPKSTVVVLR